MGFPLLSLAQEKMPQRHKGTKVLLNDTFKFPNSLLHSIFIIQYSIFKGFLLGAYEFNIPFQSFILRPFHWGILE